MTSACGRDHRPASTLLDEVSKVPPEAALEQGHRLGLHERRGTGGGRERASPPKSVVAYEHHDSEDDRRNRGASDDPAGDPRMSFDQLVERHVHVVPCPRNLPG